MKSRRQKKVDTPLSVDLLEDRCLPSALSIVPVVADLAQKPPSPCPYLSPTFIPAPIRRERRASIGRTRRPHITTRQ